MLKSVENFRPVGGLSHAKGRDSPSTSGSMRVYRSGRMDKITPEELTKLHEEKGIRSVIDLRTHGSEYFHESGMKLLDGEDKGVDVVDIRKMEMTSSDDIMWKQRSSEGRPIKHYMVEFFGTTCLRKMMASDLFPTKQRHRLLMLWVLWKMLGTKSISKYIKKLIKSLGFITLYKMAIDFCGVSIRTVMQLLSDEKNLPAVICCHHGRDRTGIMSALTLSVCGADRRAITEDYNAAQKTPDGTINELMDFIDTKYGSVQEYLNTIGFSCKEQENLKSLLQVNDASR